MSPWFPYRNMSSILVTCSLKHVAFVGCLIFLVIYIFYILPLLSEAHSIEEISAKWSASKLPVCGSNTWHVCRVHCLWVMACVLRSLSKSHGIAYLLQETLKLSHGIIYLLLGHPNSSFFYGTTFTCFVVKLISRETINLPLSRECTVDDDARRLGYC